MCGTTRLSLYKRYRPSPNNSSMSKLPPREPEKNTKLITFPKTEPSTHVAYKFIFQFINSTFSILKAKEKQGKHGAARTLQW